ncbi:MAG: hypothetical protein R3C01_18090 [Planctomycetaceae bacterium]
MYSELIDSLGVSAEVVERLTYFWTNFHEADQIVALHYIKTLFVDSYTLGHSCEGVVNYFGIDAASHFLHATAPSVVFPLDRSLSFATFHSILLKLGIELQIDKEQNEYETWIAISDAIYDWSEHHGLEVWQAWAAVYDLGPRLVPPLAHYPQDHPPRVWVIATNDRTGEFEEIDKHGPENVGTWAINQSAKRGDLALMYCVTPRSSIVSVYRVLEDAHYDPFGGWNGFRAEVGEKIPIPWIHIKQMRDDTTLNEWKLVRGNFQGLLHYEVPEAAWRRIVELTTGNDAETGSRLSELGTAAFGVRDIKSASEKWSEKEVEDRFVIPLLERLGWRLNRTLVQQVEMQIKVGSGKPMKVRADFVGYSRELTSVPLIVVEAKRRIANVKELEYAVQQAESYAGRLRCPRFAVASPEGIWVYDLQFPGVSTRIAAFQLANEPVELLSERLRDFLGFSACSSAS